MYAPNGNSIYPPQQQQHQHPQQFIGNQHGIQNPYNNNMSSPPSYQMNQIQPMPVVTQQPTPISMQRTVVGPDPTNMTCPSCRATITTTVVRNASNKTHIVAFVLFIFGCWLCCLCPYCIDSCQSAKHTCPSCNAFLGSYQN